MKRRLYSVIICLVFLLLSNRTHADIILPAVISSKMVLQRDATVKIWGWAGTNKKITLRASWLDEIAVTRSDKYGNWSFEIKTTNSKISQTMRLRSITSDITLDSILFGEVWFCSGQSNMALPLVGKNGQPVLGGNLAIAMANNPNLRLFHVEKTFSKQAFKDVRIYAPWSEATPDQVFKFSAVAYFFGQQLQEKLDCPVGIISSASGGHPIQAWLNPQVLRTLSYNDLLLKDTLAKNLVFPGVMYNSMVHPLLRFTIKGVLWYHGETNIKDPESYKILFPAMVKNWREEWQIGDFPFYFVQITPFRYEEEDRIQSLGNSAFFREAQLECLDLIPNSGIAITMDLGAEDCIHPPRKKEIADRLLLHVLNQTYGYTQIDYASPMFDTFEIKDNGIILTFKNAETGLYAYDGLTDFEVAGEDKIFHPATAFIVEQKRVFVKSTAVKSPIAVRYAWYNWTKGSLFDTNLLPAPSFRTDDWDDATRQNK